jgi:hypothetical protein
MMIPPLLLTSNDASAAFIVTPSHCQDIGLVVDADVEGYKLYMMLPIVCASLMIKAISLASIHLQILMRRKLS